MYAYLLRAAWGQGHFGKWVVFMERRKIRGFLLRLSPTLRDEAEGLAREEGISLNHFISLALAEKIARLESACVTSRERKPPLAVPIKPLWPKRQNEPRRW